MQKIDSMTIAIIIISLTLLSGCVGKTSTISTSATNSTSTTNSIVEYTAEERDRVAELVSLIPEDIQQEFEAIFQISSDSEYKLLTAYCKEHEGYALALLLRKYLDGDDYFFQEQCLNSIALSRYRMLMEQAKIYIYSQTVNFRPNPGANLDWKTYIKHLIEVTHAATYPEQYGLSSTPESPDEIVMFDNYGPLYRANLLAVGQPGTYPVIESKEEGLDGFIMRCRRNIETSADTSVNNIFYVYAQNINPANASNQPLEIYVSAIGLPEGVTFEQSDIWHGSGAPFQCKRATALEIEDTVQPDEYPFEYLININGSDMGALSCTLVIE